MKDFASSVAMGNLNEPLLMDKENLFGSFTESFDIMREELSQSKKREIELQRREKELIASLRHDLKTPITGIKLTSELLKAKLSKNSDGQEEDTIRKLDNIYNKADQIDVLVSDLFTASLDDLGEFKVNTQDEESRIIKDIVVKFDDKNLVSQSDIPDVVINIDQNRMSQVIGNIITNSYKYAGTKIDISYELIEGFLQMVIRDFGPGVPQDELSLVANKFYRGKSWRESDQSGNGLGLYIANTLMLKMNGELIPESRDGFIVTLLIPLS
jgi:signal transduction histidine kinase